MRQGELQFEKTQKRKRHCCGPYGKHYDAKLDGERVRRQRDVIKAQMLVAGGKGTWLTLEEIAKLTGYPQASISAQLRHLRKKAFGGYVVEKRRRGEPGNGCWEYQVTETRK